LKRITNLQLSGNSVLNWFFQGKTYSIRDEPFFIKTGLYSHINNVFDNIETSNENEIQIQLKKFREKDYQNTSLFRVIDVQKTLYPFKENFSHFLIHGSTSDLQISAGWSDFDSMAVIRDIPRNRKEVCNLLDACIDLDTEMRKIDKLQHHGIHYIHEKELKSYPQLYLPHQLLSDAKCLLGSNSLTINPVASRDQEIERFKSIVRTFKDASFTGFLDHHPLDNVYLEENFQNIHTMYQLKYCLSIIMLLPTLWLNLNDVYCKKKDSFDMIKNYFDESDLEILLKASHIRTCWKNSEIKDNKIPDWVAETLEEKYLERGYVFAKTLSDRLWKH
jgi:hypothetical protein